jgi:hypothetical protein
MENDPESAMSIKGHTDANLDILYRYFRIQKLKRTTAPRTPKMGSAQRHALKALQALAPNRYTDLRNVPSIKNPTATIAGLRRQGHRITSASADRKRNSSTPKSFKGWRLEQSPPQALAQRSIHFRATQRHGCA